MANPNAIALATPNWQTPMPSHPHDAGIFNPNILNQARKEVYPSMYRWTPYMDLPLTTVVPKKCSDKTKNKVKNANVSPLNLRNAFANDNVGGDDVMFLGERDTNYFWRQLVPHSCMPGNHSLERANQEGWLSDDMPINAGGNHWVTGAINLPASLFYLFDSMHSEETMLMLEQQVRDWTPVINGILQSRGCFNGTGRQPHDFLFIYNDGIGHAVPQ
ncbi:phospholipase-like protein [Tanacetum coccineum]